MKANKSIQIAFRQGDVPTSLASQLIGDVRVELVDTLEGVVFQVITLEHHGARQDVRQVGQDAGRRVGPGRPEKQVVRALVDQDPERVVGKGAHESRGRHDEPPRTRREKNSKAHLEGDDADDDPEGPRVLADLAAHLRVAFEDPLRARPVGLG